MCREEYFSGGDRCELNYELAYDNLYSPVWFPRATYQEIECSTIVDTVQCDVTHDYTTHHL